MSEFSGKRRQKRPQPTGRIASNAQKLVIEEMKQAGLTRTDVTDLKSKPLLSQYPTTASPRMVVDIFNTENPRSLVNIVSPALRTALLDPMFPRHWLDLPESFLRQRVFKFIEERDTKLRLLFWDEYNQAQDEHRMMIMDRALAGVCHTDYFHSIVLKDPHKLAWIITPPQSYEVTMRDLLQMSLMRLREVLSLDIVDGKGRPNVSLIKEMVKIHALVDNRVQGAVRQTLDVNQKTLSLDLKAKMSLDNDPAEKQIKQIDEEIASLQLELSQNFEPVAKVVAENPGILEEPDNDVIEVEP